MRIIKTKYRVVLHPDLDGFPNHWLVQYRKWYQKKWRYCCGFYPSKEEAYRCKGEWEHMKGTSFRYTNEEHKKGEANI